MHAMVLQKLSEPQNPDEISRIAGKEIYGTPVGVLRRAELYRLGNAWGHEFPVGASKDHMLVFFKQLEAEGKNPLRPPSGNLDEAVKARDVSFSRETHGVDFGAEKEAQFSPEAVLPRDKSPFEIELENTHMGTLKKICKMRGISHTNKDKKAEIIAKILAVAEGGIPQDDQDVSRGD